LDGAPFASRLDGSALELDPGPHTLRFEHASFPSVEQHVVLREGERDRVISVSFVERESMMPSAPAPSLRTVLGSGHPASRPIPWITYVLGGVSVAAVGTATYFGLRALAERRRKLDECAPLCSERDKRDVERPAVWSDVFVGVALVSVGGTLYTYWTRPVINPPFRSVTTDGARGQSSDVTSAPIGGDRDTGAHWRVRRVSCSALPQKAMLSVEGEF
jgi:hypothetical protein